MLCYLGTNCTYVGIVSTYYIYTLRYEFRFARVKFSNNIFLDSLERFFRQYLLDTIALLAKVAERMMRQNV